MLRGEPGNEACLPACTLNNIVLSLCMAGSAAVPHRVFPQASIICSSAVSADRSLLAVGLQSGVVLVWNQKTGHWVALGDGDAFR